LQVLCKPAGLAAAIISKRLSFEIKQLRADVVLGSPGTPGSTGRDGQPRLHGIKERVNSVFQRYLAKIRSKIIEKKGKFSLK
jgi:hypothetical protein